APGRGFNSLPRHRSKEQLAAALKRPLLRFCTFGDSAKRDALEGVRGLVYRAVRARHFTAGLQIVRAGAGVLHVVDATEIVARRALEARARLRDGSRLHARSVDC